MKAVRIAIVNCFDTYEARVRMLEEYFLKQGNAVNVFTADFRHFHKEKRNYAPQNYFLVKTKPYKRNISVARIISHMKFAKEVRYILQKQNQSTDLIWVMLPPNSLAKEMAYLKNKSNGLKLVFDIIDVWPETMPFYSMERIPPIKYWKNLRNKYLCYADMVVTECKLFQEKIANYVMNDKMSNLYFAKKDNECLVNNVTDRKEIVLGYIGSINNIIDIETIGSIVKQIKEHVPVILHIIGDGEKREEFIKLCQESGALVKYHGVIYETKKKAEILGICDFGLNIMKDTVCVGLTMKSIDYMAVGLPLINNIHGDTWQIVERNRLGVNYPFEIESLISLRGRFETRMKTRKFFEEYFSSNAFEKKMDEIMMKVRD